MFIAGYQINLDALLARIMYRWHIAIMLGMLAVGALSGFASGIIPPFWRDPATLGVIADPAAVITVDGRPWPRPLYAGDHHIIATLPDGRASWADVTLAASETLTITMPAGLPTPRVQALPPAAPGMVIAQVWRSGDSWRVQSAQAPAPVTANDDGTRMQPTPAATVMPSLIAVNPRGMERLTTIDAYGGLADQLTTPARTVEAVFVPNQQAGYGDRSIGTVEVRGWPAASAAITLTHPLTLLRFSPAGDALLLVEQTTATGVQASIADDDGRRLPLIAMPGQVTRVVWRADGQALALHSIDDTASQSQSRDGPVSRLYLTLVRLEPVIAAVTVADLDAAMYAGDGVPLTWGNEGALWIAPDDAGNRVLWRAPLKTLIPERRQALDALALTLLPDGDLRVLLVQGDYLMIGRLHGDVLIGETVVLNVPIADDLTGQFAGDELVVQSGGRAWLLDLAGQ